MKATKIEDHITREKAFLLIRDAGAALCVDQPAEGRDLYHNASTGVWIMAEASGRCFRLSFYDECPVTVRRKGPYLGQSPSEAYSDAVDACGGLAAFHRWSNGG